MYDLTILVIALVDGIRGLYWQQISLLIVIDRKYDVNIDINMVGFVPLTFLYIFYGAESLNIACYHPIMLIFKVFLSKLYQMTQISTKILKSIKHIPIIRTYQTFDTIGLPQYIYSYINDLELILMMIIMYYCDI